jgi:hypothetical protein
MFRLSTSRFMAAIVATTALCTGLLVTTPTTVRASHSDSSALPRPLIVSKQPGLLPAMPVLADRAVSGPQLLLAQRVASTGKAAAPEFSQSPSGPTPEFPTFTTGVVPGEPSLAVNSTDILETENGSYAVYGKGTGSNGGPLLAGPTPLSSLFNNQDCGDPVTLYSSIDSRFFITCTVTQPYAVHLAISGSDDPTQGWLTYTISPPSFLDQPSMTVTSDKILITGDLNGSSAFYVINKAQALQGSAALCSYTAHADLYRAAVRYSYLGNANAYAVADWPQANVLMLASVSGFPPIFPFSCPSMSEIPVYSKSASQLSNVPIPGGTLGGSGGSFDNRITNAVEVTDSSGHEIVEMSSTENVGSQKGAEVVRLDISNSNAVPTVVHIFDFWEGNDGFDYTYGAVTLDSSANVYVTYTRTSPNQMPQAAEAALTGSGAFLFNQIIHGATGTGCGPGPNCVERWGDYLGAAQDGVDPTQVWVSSLYQNGGGGSVSAAPLWGVVIAAARQNAVE